MFSFPIFIQFFPFVLFCRDMGFFLFTAGLVLSRLFEAVEAAGKMMHFYPRECETKRQDGPSGE